MRTDPSNELPPPDDKVDPKPTLTQLFSRYPIQTSIMQNLNFYDFRNLQLAGCQVLATSRAVQRKYLIPIHCNQTRYEHDRILECGKTPENGHEMKPCQGFLLRPGDPRVEHDGLHHKSFWVCNECRYQSQEDYQHFRIFGEAPCTNLCKMHSLEESQRFPQNACRCWTNAIGDWRCDPCVQSSFDFLVDRSERALEEVPSTTTVFGISTFGLLPHMDPWWIQTLLGPPRYILKELIPSWFLSKLDLRRRYPDIIRAGRLCPMENCRRAEWESPQAMQMCLECKAIFPNRALTFGGTKLFVQFRD